MPSASVDLVVTSPPYNIGKPYERVRPLDEYLDWCGEWMRELARVCAPHGSVWLNFGYLHVRGRGDAVPLPYLIWDKAGLYLLQEIVWYYRAGVSCRRRFSPRNEKLLWFVKSPTDYVFNLDAVRVRDVRYPDQKRRGRLRCNPRGRNPSDVWEIPKVTAGYRRSSSERTAHPTQMPLLLAERVIRACSNPGDVVLDPFAGSGTTGVAALALDRRAILIEQYEPYVAVAAERLGLTASGGSPPAV